ncbi:GyrI-like domain-containing protein [Isoptericola croceus]|uniref:GyrI-like domain-containing protein n=1 Tax=Isoptericola croceus TaxID=3031406 RepID=UPI0023F6333F|nr:GyrI-like domain-containing protein [Isoptericola croceus]
MASIDLKKTYREHYTARTTPSRVAVPPRPYLLVDGAGDPNTSPVYRGCVETLYPLAYAVRSAIKDATGDAYTVMPLEGLWWSDDISRFSVEAKGDWLWTLMICLPDASAALDVPELVARVTGERALPAGNQVRYEHYGDGEAAQVLHRGPYATEAPTVEALHAFIAAEGLALRGRHHEIYLSDPRRVAPERMRTIIRQPVTPS